jgi:hypothetical protein
MDLPEELSRKLDFSHGKKFKKEILQLFGSSVHHPNASTAGSFFLLATFRRYTFWLTEESVAFSLASCLGGSPAGFHVQFQSDRHFRFSVSNKAVGFHVYSLRRFIGDHFDVYFHLWRDGTANWEREKRIWEDEQRKEWTEVLSKSKKRKAKSNKKVSFAAAPSFVPRQKTVVPSISVTRLQSSMLVGQIEVPIHFSSEAVFGSCSSGSSEVQFPNPACKSKPPIEETHACRSQTVSANLASDHDSVQRAITCSNCLVQGHETHACRSQTVSANLACMMNF